MNVENVVDNVTDNNEHEPVATATMTRSGRRTVVPSRYADFLP